MLVYVLVICFYIYLLGIDIVRFVSCSLGLEAFQRYVTLNYNCNKVLLFYFYYMLREVINWHVCKFSTFMRGCVSADCYWILDLFGKKFIRRFSLRKCCCFKEFFITWRISSKILHKLSPFSCLRIKYHLSWTSSYTEIYLYV